MGAGTTIGGVDEKYDMPTLAANKASVKMSYHQFKEVAFDAVWASNIFEVGVAGHESVSAGAAEQRLSSENPLDHTRKLHEIPASLL
jgi:hypothetical protein